MSKLKDVIAELDSDDVRYSTVVTSAWNDMMKFASLRGLVRYRRELLSFIEVVGSGSKVKKHTKKLRYFFNEYHKLTEVDLNSSTYIKHVLTPLKALNAEFKEWKGLSVAKVVDADTQKKIAKLAKAEGEEAVKIVKEIIAKAA